MSAAVREPYDDAAHQRGAVALGVWLFLAQEVLFFGVLFVLYAALRLRHPEVFARYAPELDWKLAAAMTATLLLSSFTMALAVRAAFLRARGALLAALTTTAALGVAFLAMKGWEYAHHLLRGQSPVTDLAAAGRPGQATFFALYFVITGFHALHVLAGIGVIVALAIACARTPAPALRGGPTLAVGLYWHFVDIVWLFVFPQLYLVGRAP